MNSKQTSLLAVAITGIAATILAAFTATPEVMTQLIVGVEALAASALVVCVLVRLPGMKTLPVPQQRQLIWLTAGGTGAVICLLPLILRR